MGNSYLTNHTLLGRALNLNDQDAWDQLYRYYSNFIYFILKQIGVKPDDLDDVTQQVMLTLMSSLKSYSREKGSFRGWFRRIIKTTALLHFRRERADQKRRDRLQQHSPDEELAIAPSDIEDFIEDEWKKYVSTIALENLRKNFQGQAVEVFELGLKGLNTQEIANQTGLTTSTVYTLRMRVKKNLLREARHLIQELEGGSI